MATEVGIVRPTVHYCHASRRCMHVRLLLTLSGAYENSGLSLSETVIVFWSNISLTSARFIDTDSYLTQNIPRIAWGL